MFDSIHIEKCFAHQDSTFNLTGGMTAITGPNYSGKSQILEMIRFALWGSVALRTKAEDYKGARVTLDWHLRGIGYRVERTISNAKLFREDDLTTSGTRPVNQKIAELFGYGIAVFDTANVANQGMIEALSAMRPAERKRLVDSTVGLNVLDDLAKFCADEAAGAGKEAAAMLSVLVVPIEPERPAGWLPVVELEALRDELIVLDGEARDLARRVAAVPPQAVEPPCTEPRDLGTLEGLQRQRSALAGDIARKTKERKLILTTEWMVEGVDELEAQWDRFEAKTTAEAFMKRYPKPTVGEELCVLYEKRFEDYEDYQAWEKLNSAGHHECPACFHKWPINADKMSHLKDWGNEITPPMAPTAQRGEVVLYRKLIREYEETQTERGIHRLTLAALEGKDCSRPKEDRSIIPLIRKGLEGKVRHLELSSEIEALTQELSATPDPTSSIETRKDYERSHAMFLRAKELRDAYDAALPTWEARIVRIGDVSAQLTSVLATLVEVQIYDRLVLVYATAKEAHDAARTMVESLQATVEQFTRAKLALVDLKSRIKTYLVPSLSAVATRLLSRMTNGALGDIEVSEDWEITVGGISIDGLSGAGKAAANLALRIGLGQVLTNRTFSVFMADEIDASMDTDNAQSVAECLRNLTESISQIILVSHKTPDADHQIQL